MYVNKWKQILTITKNKIEKINFINDQNIWSCNMDIYSVMFIKNLFFIQLNNNKNRHKRNWLNKKKKKISCKIAYMKNIV
jgi:hypothetical protein